MRIFDQMQDDTKSAKRMEQLENRQHLARASRASSVGTRTSRPPTHSGVHQRLTAHSEPAGGGLTAEDVMLEPSAVTSRAEARALPEVVAALEARVRDLEAMLISSQSKGVPLAQKAK